MSDKVGLGASETAQRDGGLQQVDDAELAGVNGGFWPAFIAVKAIAWGVAAVGTGIAAGVAKLTAR